MKNVIENLKKHGVSVADEELLTAVLDNKVNEWLENNPQDKDSPIFWVNSVGLDILNYRNGDDVIDLLICIMEDGQIKYSLYEDHTPDFYNEFKESLEMFELAIIELNGKEKE